jgi:anti-anti-sigma factor
MSISVSHRTDSAAIHISVRGEVDLSTRDTLATTLQEVTALETTRTLIVDLDKVTFLDASGAATLMRARHDAALRGISLRVVNPHYLVRTVLDLCGCGWSPSTPNHSDAGARP